MTKGSGARKGSESEDSINLNFSSNIQSLSLDKEFY